MIETGIYFGNVHSFYDLDMILSKVEVSPATPKTTFIDIPGGDGSLDLTEAHGEVKYSDRVISVILSMNPGSDLSETAWEEKKTEVSNRINGLACNITLDKDPDYYWTGRCTVDSYKSNKRLRQIVVVARVRPYKFKREETVVTVDLSSHATADVLIPTVSVTLENARKTVCPTISCTEDRIETRITFGGNTYSFGVGTHKSLDIRLVQGDNTVEITGTGTVTFTYQEGDL